MGPAKQEGREGYCGMLYRCYATIARTNISFLVPAGKHVNIIRSIAKQSPIITIEGLWEAVFSVGSAPKLYSEDPAPAECSSVE
jgi:hypothetical protein